MKFDKVIRFIAMKRSGHHAFMSWMADHLDANVSFINNIAEESANNLLIAKSITDSKINRLNEHLPNRSKFLFYNLEDFKPNTQELISPVDQDADLTIYVHRNVFNLFASRIKVMDRNDKDHWYGKRAFITYNDLSRYVLSNTNIICISYDLWLSDKTYRIKLGQILKLNKSCEQLPKKHSMWGGGSSFSANSDLSVSMLLNRNKTLNSDQIAEIERNLFMYENQIKERCQI